MNNCASFLRKLATDPLQYICQEVFIIQRNGIKLTDVACKRPLNQSLKIYPISYSGVFQCVIFYHENSRFVAIMFLRE